MPACSYCGVMFTSKRMLDWHLATVHLVQQNANNEGDNSE